MGGRGVLVERQPGGPGDLPGHLGGRPGVDRLQEHADGRVVSAGRALNANRVPSEPAIEFADQIADIPPGTGWDHRGY